jgi:hypothetical protein
MLVHRYLSQSFHHRFLSSAYCHKRVISSTRLLRAITMASEMDLNVTLSSSGAATTEEELQAQVMEMTKRLGASNPNSKSAGAFAYIVVYVVNHNVRSQEGSKAARERD